MCPAADPIAFVTERTKLDRPPLVPELVLHLATEVTPLWEATEAELERQGVHPPYWAFAWPGGQALARHIIDNPSLVAGRRVFDFAAGSGIAAIAAKRAGAASVTANEIDPFALAALELNAAANHVALSIDPSDRLQGALVDVDVLLCGDVCYERAMSERALSWMRRHAAAGVLVLLGDPGRAYLPADGLDEIACHTVPTSLDLEDRTERRTRVLRLCPD